jgi:Raf kinase inhibitor-like YbhB/YbcL family protein
MSNQNGVKALRFFVVFILVANVCVSQTSSGFKLISSAFEEGKRIPARYTCDSSNVSPPLSWTGFPGKTKSFAIIMDDPDAPMGTWVHWVIYNIPGTVTSLGEKGTAAEIKAMDGLNSWDEKGYNGPCPPDGMHHYNFKIYALDQTLTPKEGMTKDELVEAIKGHILSETKLTGLFRVE